VTFDRSIIQPLMPTQFGHPSAMGSCDGFTVSATTGEVLSSIATRVVKTCPIITISKHVGLDFGSGCTGEADNNRNFCLHQKSELTICSLRRYLQTSSTFVRMEHQNTFLPVERIWCAGCTFGLGRKKLECAPRLATRGASLLSSTVSAAEINSAPV